MTPTSTVPVRTGSLEVPDGRLYYELRGEGPLVVLVGAPMDANSFAPLADLLATDHTVLTTDPRGINRSTLHNPLQDSTPALRGDDLYRLLTHVDAGRATILGSSGGAITALALAQTHPELLATVIAHEPPIAELLDDRDEIHAQTDDVIISYLGGDVLGAWTKFFEQADIKLPPGAVEYMFGGDRDPQAVADERRWFAHELRGTTHWQPDLDALRAVADRIVIGIGEESTGQECDRTSRALGAELGIEPTLFPGDHTGFAEDPAAFEPRLREVLAR
ncbi:MAG TPA: alpha/beta hydrolase [Kribbellaceae bacterium]|nr:alpha/beta hydrolase [Kribbellaceae bacterium]